MTTTKKTTAKTKKTATPKAAKIVAPVAKAKKAVATAAAPAKKAKPAPAPVTTEAISGRAFALWDQAGRPQGRDLEFWLQAETQLKQETKALAA